MWEDFNDSPRTKESLNYRKTCGKHEEQSEKWAQEGAVVGGAEGGESEGPKDHRWVQVSPGFLSDLGQTPCPS